MKKTLTCVLLACLLLVGIIPMVSAASNSWEQITGEGATRYYDKDGNPVTSSPSLGENAVVSVSKSIEGTDIENEFLLTLDVKTSMNLSEVKVSPDAAVIITLDVSGSMAPYMTSMKNAARSFLDSYVKDAGNAKRYAALVVFQTSAEIQMSWVDVTVPSNLNAMKNAISNIATPQIIEMTNVEGGLLLARNLLRKDGFPVGNNGAPIENRSVILFSDGAANRYAVNNPTGVAVGTSVTGNSGNDAVTAQARAETMAGVVKGGAPFNGIEKHDALLFTIAFGSEAPAQWLSANIATNDSFAYEAVNAAELNRVFEAIVTRIQIWAQAWMVTDPMGPHIDFATTLTSNDLNSGLAFDSGTKTLTWDLKRASYTFNNNTYSYAFQYRIRLNTSDNGFIAGESYPTNGATDLTYVMTIDGQISSDVLRAPFIVPSVKGYGGEGGGEKNRINFVKKGGDGANLSGCVFRLTNLNNPSHTISASSNSAGVVTFDNIPSGQTYELREVSMPDPLKIAYLQSTDVYTVTVAFGEAVVRNSLGAVVANGFSFVNPMAIKVVTGNAGSITANSAVISDNTYTGVLAGTLNYAAVQFSTSPTMSSPNTVSAAASASPYSVSLSGLLPGTTYYYRACIYTNSGTYYADEIKSFTTPAQNLTYYIEYYRDDLDTDISMAVGGTVPAGTGVTLTDAQLNRYRPNGYLPGVQQGAVPVSITDNGQVIKVLYTKTTGLTYSVKYYVDSIDAANIKGEVNGTGAYGDPIDADLTLFAPDGYIVPGVRSGPDTIGLGSNEVSVVYSRLPSLSYYIQDFKDDLTAANEIRMSVGGQVPLGTDVTLTNDQINMYRPAGYVGSQVGSVPVKITVNGQIIQVLYTKMTNIAYTVNYYAGTIGGTLLGSDGGTGDYGDPIPADLTKYYPGTGYQTPGVRSGPNTIGEDPALNVVSVVFPEVRLSYTIEYYMETDMPEPSLLGRSRMTAVIPNTQIVLTAQQLEVFHPAGTVTLPGEQLGGPVTITTNGQIIKVIYRIP